MNEHITYWGGEGGDITPSSQNQSIFFENQPTVQTDGEGNIIIMDDLIYPIDGMDRGECVSIYVVQKNDTNKTRIIYQYIGEPANFFKLDPIDGFISFWHVVLPTKAKFDTNPEHYIYWSDGGKVYKKDGDNDVEVDIQEIIEINSARVLKHVHNFFSVYHLRKCYVSLCQKIFNDRGFDRCFNSKVDKHLLYKRDLVWAALNVIQYMIDLNQLAEAQRLLERINGCNGLCAGENTGEHNCGCDS